MEEQRTQPVSKFLDQFDSTGTRKNYKSSIKNFFQVMYPDENWPNDNGEVLQQLDELSSQYLQEERNHKDDLVTFKKALNGKAPVTKKTKIQAVRMLLDDNDITFSQKLIKRLNGKGADKSISLEKVPNRAQLREILRHLPHHAETLAMFLATSGMRVGEALKLRISDVDLEADPMKIRVRGQTTKTGNTRITFISPVTAESLKAWLQVRDDFLEKKVRSQTRDRAPDLLFPFSFNSFNGLWKKALQNAGLYETCPDTNRVTRRLHTLRKYFSTYGEWTNTDARRALMGHKAGLDAIYNRYEGKAEEILLQEYVKAIPHLEIYGDGRDVQELAEELEKKDDRIKEIELNQNENYNYLIGENSKLQGKVSRLSEVLDIIIEAYEKEIKERDNEIFDLNAEIVRLKHPMLQLTEAEREEASRQFRERFPKDELEKLEKAKSLLRSIKNT